MAMPAAVPALMERVEPNCSMASTASASATRSSETPGPSWPKTRTQRSGRSNISISCEPGTLSIASTASPSWRAQFKGKAYLLHYALPNFYFHATTAYDILRHNGLDIGKRDFIGSV